MLKKRFKVSAMMKQKLYGLMMLGLCTAITALAADGGSPGYRDASALLLFVPLGLYTVFTKERVLIMKDDFRGLGKGSSQKGGKGSGKKENKRGIGA